MGIFLRQSHNVKPVRWGSPADVQYSIWRNLEDIYGCNHKSEVMIMPMFWGFPLLDYSKYGNHGTNHGATYKDGSLDFDGDNDYVDCGGSNSLDIGTSDYTVSAWIKTSTDDDVLSTNSDAAWHPMYIQGTTGLLRMQISTVFGSPSGGSQDVSDGSLKHVVISANRDGIASFYVDGAVDGTGLDISSVSAYSISITNFYVGDDFDGIIDEVRISKATRTANQIALFHDRPWDFYRRVAKPIWSIPAAPSIYIPRIIMF